MGGLTGHMIHPYECKELTVGQVKDMVRGIFNGEIELTEKVDGMNIQVTVNTKGEVVFLRNKGDLNSVNGGMTLDQMKVKWADNPDVMNTFVSAGEILINALKGKRFSFNPRCDLKYTLNCECVRAGKTNVMPYGKSMVIVHNIWVYRRGEQGWEKVCESTRGLNRIIGNGVDGPVKLTMKSNECDDLIVRIEEVLGRNNDRTIEYEMWNRYIDFVYNNESYRWILSSARGCRALYLRWFWNEKTINLKELKEIYRDNIPALSGIESSNGKGIVTAVTKDIDDLFIEIGQSVMGSVTGYINEGNDDVVEDLMDDLEEVVDTIMESGNEEQIYKVDYQLRRMRGGLLPIEGVVFNWNGRLMKLTGNFAPLNQIMGFNKFAR